MSDFNAAREAPMPTTLSDAIEEIRKLRRRLFQANEKWAIAKLKGEQDRRSLAGELKIARADIETLKKQLSREVDRGLSGAWDLHVSHRTND